MAKTLGDLRPGESGYVSLIGSVDPVVRRRLTDMGITPLTQVSVIKIAPLGDPMEVYLRGYELTLRKSDAQNITLMGDGEASDALRRESELRVQRGASAKSALTGHMEGDDTHAHELAARLTGWSVNASPTGIELSPKKSAKPAAYVKASGASPRPVKIALAGNPNSGKTTLFNALTGSREYVGNWPGVTVEKKEGRIKAYGHEMLVVDLPGIYSLSPYSMEEVIARSFIIEEKPDVIINIVDGTNLERNLYLTLQLMELERPMVLALNMMDEVEKHGDEIDVIRLAKELGIPVVPISARTKEGVDELVKNCSAIIALAHAQAHQGFNIEPDHVFDSLTHAAHHKIGALLNDKAQEAGLPRHWAEIKLLELDDLVLEKLKLNGEELSALAKIINEYTGGDSNFDSSMRLADSRYRFISNIVNISLKRNPKQKERSFSYRIDRVLTHKYFAIPIFLAVMLLIFAITFGTVGSWLSDQMSMFINYAITPALRGFLLRINTSYWLVSLICDGVIGGVGGVLEFLPQIALLFLCLSFLEDSGYLSRTAFIMDKLLQRFGLSGRSFIPMLMGFGCTVPATMSARTMENEKHRRMTVLLLPFISCSAKLPVYGLIASAFFASRSMLTVFSLYILGILIGILTGFLFKKTLFRGKTATFVMEMPPYRWPTWQNTLQHVGERVLHFLEKAGTIILCVSVLIWFLQSFDLSLRMVENATDSMLGTLGSLIAPALKPLGFGTWQAAVALLTGFVAKEAVVSSLSLLYGFSAAASGTAIRASLSATFSPLSAYAFLVFVLLYAPCMAAVTTMRKELNSVKWTLFMVVYQIAIAYVAAMLVFQIGLLLGLG